MNWITILIILLVTYVVYRYTRSFVWTVLTLLASILVVPLAVDQLTALMNGGVAPTVSNQNPSAGGSCACN